MRSTLLYSKAQSFAEALARGIVTPEDIRSFGDAKIAWCFLLIPLASPCFVRTLQRVVHVQRGSSLQDEKGRHGKPVHR
jgi:hypothetical protein